MTLHHSALIKASGQHFALSKSRLAALIAGFGQSRGINWACNLIVRRDYRPLRSDVGEIAQCLDQRLDRTFVIFPALDRR